jgi:hypothetical protein
VNDALSLADARDLLESFLDAEETEPTLALWHETEALKDYIQALENAQALD